MESDISSNEESRAVCAIKSPKLRRTLERALRAAGYTAQFVASAAELEAGVAPILFIDHDTRLEASPETLLAAVGDAGSVVMIGESIADDDVAVLLRNPTLDHLISESQSPDEIELLVTSVKLITGDIFGLEKYLPWGAKVHERKVGNYEEKRAALDAVTAHAKSVGARRALIARLEHVADELLMNALYDAPAVSKGVSTASRISELAQAGAKDFAGECARLRYGCDGRYFLISAHDNYGMLKKEVILDHLIRARESKGQPKPEGGQGGAGLGLYFVLSSVSQFIVNVVPGQQTEVVCLFDLRQSGREMESCAQSVHIFTGSADAAA